MAYANSHDPDIDVFKTHTKMDLDNLPSVDVMPLLPGMRAHMDLDLAVNTKGDIFVFFDGKIAETLEYAIYSIDDAAITFVSTLGRIQDIGMTVQRPMRKYMKDSSKIHMIKMDKTEPTGMTIIPLIVQNIGL